MNTRIDASECAEQDPYRLFLAMLQLVNDSCVANMRASIGQMSTSKMQNLASEELVRHQRARNEAERKADAERVAQDRAEQMESRAKAIAARKAAQAL